MPFKAMEPFSMIWVANFLSNVKMYSQLPFFATTSVQVATVSTCPCTICPSILPFNFQAPF